MADLGKVLAWGSLPPPVHGSSVMNRVMHQLLTESASLTWVNSAVASGVSGLGKVTLTAACRSLVPMLRYCLLGAIGLRRHTAYISIAVDGPARFRDAFIWLWSIACAERTIIHVHSGHVEGLVLGRPLRRLSVALTRRSEVWILHSTLAGHEILGSAGAVRILENGVGCNSLNHEERLSVAHAARSSASPTRVVFLSNHFREKGPLIVGAAAAVLMRESPDRYEFLFIGAAVDPAVERELAEFMSEARNHWRLSSPDVDDKCVALGQADLLCMPSRWPLEGQPLVLLEAAAHGTPAVVTDFASLKATAGPTGRTVASVEQLIDTLREHASRGLDWRLAEREEVLTRWRDHYSETAFRCRAMALLVERPALRGDS